MSTADRLFHLLQRISLEGDMVKQISLLFTFAMTLLSPALAADGQRFSELSEEAQLRLRASVAPPAAKERTGPYSTPMYYLMRKGYTYQGDLDRDPENRPHPPMKGQPLSPDYDTWAFDKARPDIQEVMIRDWVDLGMNVSHLNIHPIDGSLSLSEDYIEAIQTFLRLSEKHDLKIGVRLDALDWWSMHPANPENRIDEYLVWVKRVMSLLKGRVLYCVVGDELSIGEDALIPPGREWSVEQYLDYFGRVRGAIKEVDPNVKVSMFAVSYGHYSLVPRFLAAGYADIGDAITVNSNDIEATRKLFAEVRKVKPDMMFLSNGVGYLACEKAQPQYPLGTPYTQIATEEEHGAAVAKVMFSWWDLGASTAPYYVSLRNWVINGKQYPYWYGFFGFEDYVVSDDKMSVKHYAAASAFQTVAKTFYNREDFQVPKFDVTLSQQITQFKAYEHRTAGGAELICILWNDSGEVETELTIANTNYRHPVRVNLFDLNDWSDVDSSTDEGRTTVRLKVGKQPTILRLIQLDPVAAKSVSRN
jgi:hypothetical protein